MLDWIKDYLAIKKSGQFDPELYLRRYPDVRAADIGPLMHYVLKGRREGRKLSAELNSLGTRTDDNPNSRSIHIENLAPIPEAQNAKEIQHNHRFETAAFDANNDMNNPNLEPLRWYKVEEHEPRINLITDSINAGSLFGGVATSLILATLMAEKFDYSLRIITRTEAAVKRNYKIILAANGIAAADNVEFVFANCNDSRSAISLAPEDVFISTSWWTTFSALQTIDPSKIIYLLQEDERNFYAHDDYRYLSTKMMSDNNIIFLVNSKLLFDHLVAEGFDNILQQGRWFEPSFTENNFHFDHSLQRMPLNFMFYARPNNVRNLYSLGKRVIIRALDEGILDQRLWNINFVGKDLSNSEFDKYRPVDIYQNLDLQEYARVIRKMDLGLSLMYSPHPSYPPLDLAASGAIVVTNKFGIKESLDNYSHSIICSELDEDALLNALKQGVSLAQNRRARLDNYNNAGFLRDWHRSFEQTLDFISLSNVQS